MQTECREVNNFTKRSKVHFKLELKEGKKGNLLVIVKFDTEASNFYTNDYTWCPTLDELNILNKAREAVMENKQLK